MTGLPRSRASPSHASRVAPRGGDGETRITVNSFHHQSLAQVSPELRVTATANDGIIEGVETINDWWVIGVQWHPEELTADDAPWDRRLFATFGERVRG